MGDRRKTRKPAGRGLADSTRHEDLIGFPLRLAHVAAEAHYQQLAGADAPTPRQFGMLLALHQLGRTTISDLSTRMIVDRNTVGEMLNRMVVRGLVHKEVPRHNRRVAEIWLTRSGEALLAKTLPAAIASQREVLTRVPTKHRAIFIKCLMQIANADVRARDDDDID